MSTIMPSELRLQDFAPSWQAELLGELNSLLQMWRLSQWIRERVQHRRKMSLREDMRHWCRAFIKFYVAVKLKGEPIESAFVQWVRDHAYSKARMPATFGEISHSQHCNIYMQQFAACYWEARDAYYRAAEHRQNESLHV